MSVIWLPEMEVDQLENVEPSTAPQMLDRFHELRGGESELRTLATALRPSPVAGGTQLDADPRHGHDPEIIRGLQQHIDLAQLLDDDEDLVAQPLAHQRQPHELFILVAVAHDHVVRRVRQRQHRLQLGLRTAFETDAVGLPGSHDLLDHVPLLVDLDRVHRGVAARVSELLDRLREPRADRGQPRPEDVRKAQQHGKRDALLLQIARHVE